MHNWGTDRRLDSPLWNESNSYEGKNKLGAILEEIRSALDPPALNCTAEIKKYKPSIPSVPGSSPIHQQGEQKNEKLKTTVTPMETESTGAQSDHVETRKASTARDLSY